MAELALFDPWDEIRTEFPVWGIDPSTQRFALSVVLPFGSVSRLFTVSAEMPSGASSSRRLVDAFGRMRRFFDATAEELGMPVYAVIEQPFGRNVHPQSYFFLAAGLLALELTFGRSAIVDVMDPSTWKKLALGEGHGHARKPELLRFARSLGYGENCSGCGAAGDECKPPSAADRRVHDEGDSVGIAMAAARRWVLSGKTG